MCGLVRVCVCVCEYLCACVVFGVCVFLLCVLCVWFVCINPLHVLVFMCDTCCDVKQCII